MKKWFILLVCLLLIACATDETTTEELKSVAHQDLKEKLLQLKEVFGNKVVEHSHIDEAVQEAESLGLTDKERDFFVRSYLIFISNGKDVDIEKIQEDSRLRMLYEDSWQKLASEKYGITVKEEELEDLVETYLEHFNQAIGDGEDIEGVDIFYLADKLDYSLEKFFHTFDRHLFEKWLIGVELFPILQEEYEIDEDTEISNQYRLEVIDYIVDSQL